MMYSITCKGLPLLFITFAVASAFVPAPFGARKGTLNRGLFGTDHFDMDELKQRIAQETNPYHDLFKTPGTDTSYYKPLDVHVILFNPNTDEEGVHAIEFPKGSGNNVILAFESKTECDSFAALLKEQQFFDPTPREVNLEELETSCDELGVFVQIVPKGMHVVPPSARVERLGHNPKLRHQQDLLNSLFEMSETEADEAGVLEGELGGSWE